MKCHCFLILYLRALQFGFIAAVQLHLVSIEIYMGGGNLSTVKSSNDITQHRFMENTKSLAKQGQLASVYTVLLGAVRDIGVKAAAQSHHLKTIQRGRS